MPAGSCSSSTTTAGSSAIATDGDLRRAHPAPGAAWTTRWHRSRTRASSPSTPAQSRVDALDLMRGRRIAAIPVVDADGRPVALHLLHEFLRHEPRANRALVMAGGLGHAAAAADRGRPEADAAGRRPADPRADRAAPRRLRDRAHLDLGRATSAEVIEEHFGDGAAFGADDRLPARGRAARHGRRARPAAGAADRAAARRERRPGDVGRRRRDARARTPRAGSPRPSAPAATCTRSRSAASSATATGSSRSRRSRRCRARSTPGSTCSSPWVVGLVGARRTGVDARRARRGSSTATRPSGRSRSRTTGSTSASASSCAAPGRARSVSPRGRPGPGHRGRRLHRQPPRRAPGRARAPTSARSACTTRAARRAGWTRRRRTSGTGVELTFGDIRDPRFVERATEGVEVVFHLAALIAIPYSYVAPRLVRRHQRRRHAQRARGGRPGRRPAPDPHVDERGLRHARDPARSARRTRSTPSRRTRRPRSPPTSWRSRSTGATACRSSSCARSTRTARASPSARSCRRCSASCWPGSGRSGSAGSTRGATSRSSPTRSTASSGPRRPPGSTGGRSSSAPGGPRASASCSSSRGASRAATRPPVVDEARLRPDASEVLVLQSDPSLARELLGWSADDGARGRPARRRSSGCASQPDPGHGRDPCPALSRAIALAEPTIGGNARRYLDECLGSNFVSSIGPFVTRFEEAFAAFVGSRYAVACASGRRRSTSRCSCSTSAPATRSSSRA